MKDVLKLTTKRRALFLFDFYLCIKTVQRQIEDMVSHDTEA